VNAAYPTTRRRSPPLSAEVPYASSAGVAPVRQAQASSPRRACAPQAASGPIRSGRSARTASIVRPSRSHPGARRSTSVQGFELLDLLGRQYGLQFRQRFLTKLLVLLLHLIARRPRARRVCLFPGGTHLRLLCFEDLLHLGLLRVVQIEEDAEPLHIRPWPWRSVGRLCHGHAACEDGCKRESVA